MPWNGHFYFYQQLFIFQGGDNLVLLLLELIFTISNGIPLTTSPSLLLSADPYPYDLLYNTCQSRLLHSHPQTNFSSQDSRKAGDYTTQLQKEKIGRVRNMWVLHSLRGQCHE